MVQSSESNKSKYFLNEAGEFIINDYNRAKPFSSFFPGIAGINGIPMWAFYANRGQCLSCMGIQDKDHPIMEFLPANWAYQLVSSQGFRTFVKLPDNSSTKYYEPFQNNYRDNHLKRTQRMIIAPSKLILEEINHTLKIKFRVEYQTVPQDNYAGLMRTLDIENLDSSSVALEVLDGLPFIVPYGVDNFCLKNMRRTIEAFVEVDNFENMAPFFKGKVEPSDKPDVSKITKGNFYIGFENNGSEANLVTPIVDPNKIFGTRKDYSFPEKFLTESDQDILKNQKLDNQFPCAMGLFNCSIEAGENYTYSSIIGHASSVEKLNEMIPQITRKEYFKSKTESNVEIIESLTQHNLICSNEPALDLYVRQNFLDNLQRGGFPHTLNDKGDRSTLYLYSRKHGDMERDYNDFRLMPTQYSQGNGNFRDINQNRRSDLFFNPDIQEDNLKYFYNFLQLDGFNPLVLKEISFKVADSYKLQTILEKYLDVKSINDVKLFLVDSFTPGELLSFLDEGKLVINGDSSIFIGEILDQCRRIANSDHGEGFWTDHWTYNLDLLENYLALYPDKIFDLIFNKNNFSFYDNSHRVLTRDEKYVLWEDKPMQLGAVLLDEEKELLIKERDSKPNQMHDRFGKGEVYYTTLFNKIICLIVNKLASLDPEGVGVEMEAGKPGWYDALNGLPGLFGSSVSETLEIKRHILFLQNIFDTFNVNIEEILIFEELDEFISILYKLLESELSPFEFWNNASTTKEYYREKTRLGISGKENKIEINKIKEFFNAALKKLDEGIEKARDKESGTLFTYFRYEPIDYKILASNDSANEKQNGNKLTSIKPLQFKQTALPLFLEGPVHYLRCMSDINKAKEFSDSVKKSDLYDKSLKMYKVNASLENQPMEIGRARVFSPGWLENESIWLHMEYKYILELLRNRLYNEFFEEFKNVCIPFLDPEVYGRSILENSSFIVSSAHPDSSIHGNGYVARLSGATAEFIHMLLLMVVGLKPFQMNSEGELQLCFRPSLPKWLFTKESKKIKLYRKNQKQEIELPTKSFSFMFLGEILITYHNSELKNTFGEDSVAPLIWNVVDFDGTVQTFNGSILSGEIVSRIRERKISKIDIVLQ